MVGKVPENSILQHRFGVKILLVIGPDSKQLRQTGSFYDTPWAQRGLRLNVAYVAHIRQPQRCTMAQRPTLIVPHVSWQDNNSVA